MSQENKSEITNKWFLRCNYRFYLLRKWIWHHRIMNKDATLISDDCIAGMVCSELGINLNTPFFNGGLSCSDFIKFLSNWDFYINQPLNFVTDPNHQFPVGKIGDIIYWFVHYKSTKRAKQIWEIGKKLMHLNNAFYIMTEKPGCTYDDLAAFDALPLKNKVMLTHKPYPEFKSAVYIPGSEHLEHCRALSEWIEGQYFGKRYYHQFNFLKWINDNRPR